MVADGEAVGTARRAAVQVNWTPPRRRGTMAGAVPKNEIRRRQDEKAGEMYVTSTSEDLVLRFELNGDRAFVSNFVQEGMNVSGLNNPDNLALDAEGNVYILEDNGPGDIFVARVGDGSGRVARQVDLFTSLSDCQAEPTVFTYAAMSERMGQRHQGGTLRTISSIGSQGLADLGPTTHWGLPPPLPHHRGGAADLREVCLPGQHGCP